MVPLYRRLPRRANFGGLYDQTIDLLERSSLNVFGHNKAGLNQDLNLYANGVLTQWGL